MALPDATSRFLMSQTQEDSKLIPVRSIHRRPWAGGKFLYVGKQKLWVRGVTYGTFRPDEDGCEFHNPDLVERDFNQIAASGLNSIRTYTVPPSWFLDSAQRHGLRVMVGLPWEQHVTFLEDKKRARDIEERVRAGVKACAGHPAVLCYTIGNEIPAPIVRWHGHHRVERYLERLYRAAKEEDSNGLVTYVNYPTTEYLQLPFLDLFCFNVYLEAQDRLEAYIARLQNIAGDRPLIMTEIGLDSAETARQPRRMCSTGSFGRFSALAPPAPLSSPGPTSGTAAVLTSRIGISASLEETGVQSRRWQRFVPHLRKPPFQKPCAGHVSRWSFALTTGLGPYGSAWRAC
jgi:hypothetical protein